MYSQPFELGSTPQILIKSISGNLRLSTAQGSTLTVRADHAEALKVERQDDGLQLDCESDLHLQAPPGARLEVHSISGDALLSELRGDLLLRTVGGDLNLQRMGICSVQSIGGDLSARTIDGSLMIDQVGGSALVAGVAGDVHLRSIGGDLRLNGVVGSLNVVVGGDANLRFAPQAGSKHEIQVSGDAVCRFPEDASFNLKPSVGGRVDLRMPDGSKNLTGDIVRWGAGEAEISLSVGGNLRIRPLDGDEWETPDLGQVIADRVSAELEAVVLDVESRLGELGLEFEGIDSRRITHQIHKAVSRAQRKAAKAQRRMQQRIKIRSSVGSWDATVRPGVVRDEERRMILDMLEEGKITVEEAERLLQTLEGRA